MRAPVGAAGQGRRAPPASGEGGWHGRVPLRAVRGKRPAGLRMMGYITIKNNLYQVRHKD